MLTEQKKQTNEEESIVIPRLLSAQEVGEILGISAKTVNKLARQGRLGYVELTTRKKAFTKELVEEFIKAETYPRDWTWDEARAMQEADRNL